MRPARRDVLHAAGIAAVLGVGAACARIPTESPIDSRALSGRSRPGAPYVRALPPPADAAPDDVVIGFVQAGVGPEDGYAVAREYLTEEASTRWDPGAGVTVYSGSHELRVEAVEDARMMLVLQVVSLVDERGVRSTLAGPTSQEITLRLEQVEDQWRIADPPPGIFLSDAAFETLFTPARLYFIDARSTHLVPDHRWYAYQRAATEVLEGLRDGPVDHLALAVHSEVPNTSGVSGAAVSTAPDGVVQVTVPTAVASLDSAPRGLALSQIEASLRSLRTLSEVRLVWDGEDLTPRDQKRLERPLPGHRPIGAGATGVVSLADGATAGGGGQLVPELAEIPLSSPVIAQDGILVAALNAEESVVLLASTDGSVPVREAATGAIFVPPRVDDAGYVWTSARSSGGALLALSGAGAELDAKVDAPWLVGRQIRALDLAADATRMIVLSSDVSGSRLDLTAVVRDASGVPTSLTEPTVVRTGLSDLTQASWYDEIALIVLGVDPTTGEERAQVIDFAAGRDQLPTPRPGTDRLAGTVVAESVWASTDEGVLLRSDGDAWRTVDLQATDPAFY